jgi:hypothetical protein
MVMDMEENQEVAAVIQRYMADEVSAEEAAGQIGSILGNRPPTESVEDEKVYELLSALEPRTTWPCAIITVSMMKCK